MFYLYIIIYFLAYLRLLISKGKNKEQVIAKFTRIVEGKITNSLVIFNQTKSIENDEYIYVAIQSNISTSNKKIKENIFNIIKNNQIEIDEIIGIFIIYEIFRIN